MKKIIKGKVYDTETAKELGSYSNTPYRSDFHYYEETMYRKKTGEFFIYGEGNAASKYARSVAMHETAPGEAIRPLTFQEAQEWAEMHLDAEDYADIFGEPAEDDSAVQFHAYIRSDLVEKLKRRAASQGKSLRDTLEEILSESLS